MGATTFTAGGGDIVRPYWMPGGPHPVIQTFPEATAGSFVAGEPLIQDTGSHKGNGVVVASNDPTANIIGIAVHGATGVANTNWSGSGNGGRGSRTDITVLASGAAGSLGAGVGGSLGLGIGGTYKNVNNVATLTGNDGIKGLVQVYLATPFTFFVARVISGNAITSANIGIQCGFEKDTSNLIWRIDDGDTSNKTVQIVDLFDADGDVNGRYIFKFVAAAKLLYGER